jgi:hypothetical protein
VASLDKWPALPGDPLYQRVVLGPLMAADMQDVTIAARGDKARYRAAMLQNSISRDRGAM